MIQTKTLKILLVSLIAMLCVSCASLPRIDPGVQKGYAGLNLARIAFLPLVVVNNPGSRGVLDSSLVSVDKVHETIEAAVLGAFRKQSNVKGYHPRGVMQALEGKEHLLDKVFVLMRERAKLRNTESKTLSETCLNSRSFLDFYSYCLAEESAWRDALNALAIPVSHADGVLFVVVTELEKRAEKGKFSVSAEIAVFLVDTNNGRLVWGRQQKDQLENDPADPRFPEWSSLFSRMLAEPFWIGFPGRVSP